MSETKTRIKYWLDFLLVMTEKEIKTRYRFAFLGFLWMLLNPILQMLTIGLIFQYFVRVKVDNYYLFIFVGTLLWNFFSYTVTKNTGTILNERALIQKAKFPKEVLVLSIVLSDLFHVVVSIGLLMVVLLFTNYRAGAVNWVFIPLVMVWVTILTTGFSLLFSALNVRFRDVGFVLNAIMPVWFYATPVVYSLDLIPNTINKLLYLNPMTSIVEIFRYIMMGYKPLSWDLLWLSLLSSVIVFVVGWIYFKKEDIYFDDWL